MTVAKKRALANQHEQQRILRFSNFGRSMTLLVASVLSFALIGLLLADQLLRPDAFVIEQLKLKGKFEYTQPEKIEEIVQQQPIGNFFSAQLTQIKRQVEQIEWIRSADVRREWPDTLVIQVEEHRPVMKWGSSQWLNSYGEIIDAGNLNATQEVLTLHGEPQDSSLIFRQALNWQSQLAQHELTLKDVYLSSSHAWRLHLHAKNHENTFELLIGREDVESRFQRFLTMYEQQFEQKSLELTRVDARYPNGLATVLKPIELSSTELMSKL